MSRETKPPGRTFEERWPHDAAEAEYLAGPWVPIVAGGFAGLFGVPLILSSILVGAPLPFLLIVGGSLAVATFVVAQRPGRPRAWAARLWRLSAWTLLAAGAGFLLAALGDALCADAACREAGPFEGSRAGATAITTLAVVATSVGLAILVDRSIRRLIAARRAPAPSGPR